MSHRTVGDGSRLEGVCQEVDLPGNLDWLVTLAINMLHKVTLVCNQFLSLPKILRLTSNMEPENGVVVSTMVL